MLDELFDLWVEGEIAEGEFIQVARLMKKEASQKTETDILFPEKLKHVAQKIFLRQEQSLNQHTGIC